jgi:hypothetical protein
LSRNVTMRCHFWETATTMARKVLNRKDLRDANDAAEARDKAAAASGEAPPAKVKKKAAKRKSKTKDPALLRMKLFWGVFNQNMKQIAKYDYSKKKDAEHKAAELSASGKSPHFVAKVKEEVVVESAE